MAFHAFCPLDTEAGRLIQAAGGFRSAADQFLILRSVHCGALSGLSAPLFSAISSGPVLSDPAKGCPAVHRPGCAFQICHLRQGSFVYWFICLFKESFYSTPKSAIDKIHLLRWVGELFKRKKEVCVFI